MNVHAYVRNELFLSFFPELTINTFDTIDTFIQTAIPQKGNLF